MLFTGRINVDWAVILGTALRQNVEIELYKIYVTYCFIYLNDFCCCSILTPSTGRQALRHVDRRNIALDLSCLWQQFMKHSELMYVTECASKRPGGDAVFLSNYSVQFILKLLNFAGSHFLLMGRVKRAI